MCSVICGQCRGIACGNSDESDDEHGAHHDEDCIDPERESTGEEGAVAEWLERRTL